MDAMDILGGLLGRKSSRGGLGGKILGKLIKGGVSRMAKRATAPKPQSQQPSAPTRIPQDNTPHRHSGPSLDELLAEATGHHGRRRPAAPSPSAGTEYRSAARSQDRFEPHPMNDKAEVLIRAMVSAAKSDGQIDQKEQDAIVGQLGDLDQSEVQFLRSEFAKPLDVRELAWSVPLGMEQQIYGISLMAIDLDERKEATYLAELAHGLRLPPEICNQIHEEFGAPKIF